MTPEYIHIILMVIASCAAFLTVLHILFTMQDDSEWARLWLLLLLVLPGAGVLLYWVAGISRKNTFGKRILYSVRRLALEKGAAFLHGPLAGNGKQIRNFFTAPDPGFAPVEALLDNLLYPPEEIPEESGSSALRHFFCSCTGNSAELFCDGTQGYPAMLQAIRSARKHIHLQSYIFANDPVGRAILAALRERAQNGVEVRVLFDKLGSLTSMWQLLRCKKGCPDSFHIHPFSHSSLLTPWRLQLRNHRKLLIVDGKTAFAGGLNISYENVRTPRQEGIHDYHCRIRGPVVRELQYAFLCDWFYSAGKKDPSLDFADYFPQPEPEGNNRIRVMTSGHGYHFRGTEKVFFTAAASAVKSLWIITPYFVPGYDYVKALCMAAARGVDVRIIVPENSDHWYVKLASSSHYETLMENRVQIFKRQGVFSHAKAMLVDSSWCFLGSSNCDNRSFSLNFELDLLFSAGDFPGILHRQFLEEFRHCRVLTREDLKKSPLQRIAAGICALASPVL